MILTSTTATQRFCNNTTININADGHPEFFYIWTPSVGIVNPTIISPAITPPLGSTTYSVSASYPNCPTITKSITIAVEPNPVVNLGPDREKCQWDTLQIRPIITPADFPNFTYAYTPDTNLNVGNQPFVIFNGMANDTIKLVVTSPIGCADSDVINITVHPGNFGYLPQSDTGVCPRDQVQLTASGATFYQWVPGTYLSDSNIANPIVSPQGNEQYTLYLTDQFGCLDTLGIAITLFPDAVLALPDSVILYPGDSVHFNPQGNCNYYNWFPPLGLDYTQIADPTAQPSVSTRYFVTASTESGCVTRDSVDVMVREESVIDMPNAFAPGNGPNNLLKVVHAGLAKINYFQVFNRWGQKVFETSNIEEGWDGNINGTPQPFGVYIYQFEGVTYKGKVVKKAGNVTLMR